MYLNVANEIEFISFRRKTAPLLSQPKLERKSCKIYTEKARNARELDVCLRMRNLDQVL